MLVTSPPFAVRRSPDRSPLFSRRSSGYDDCSNDPCPSSTVCLDTKDGFSCICPPWKEDCTYSEQSPRDIDHRPCFLRSLEYRLFMQEWWPMHDEFGQLYLRMPLRLQRHQLRNKSVQSELLLLAIDHLGDICIPNPCMNGGTCQSQGLLSFTCQCRPGFQGLTCQICKHRGFRVTTRNGMMYRSLLGDACVPNPCQNGGSCIFDEPTGTFHCACPPGYTGRTCDIGEHRLSLTSIRKCH